MTKWIIIITVGLIVLLLLYLYIDIKQLGYHLKNNKMYFVSTEPGGFGKYEHELLDVELGTFQVLTGDYAKDSKKVYFNGDIVNGADPKTFERIKVDPRLVQDYYSKDATNIFQGTSRLDISDVNSFQLFPGQYYKDSTAVYHKEKKIIGAVSESFKVVGRDYTWFGLDQANVYYLGNALPGADPGSFEILTLASDKKFAKDKNSTFNIFGEKLEK